MVRTTITMTREEFDAASAEAQRRGISLSELVCRSLHAMGAISQEAPWMKFAGMVESGDPQSSQRIDRTVYGED